MPLTVKIKYNEDVRRITVEEELRYVALRELAKNMFQLDEFSLKYQDVDGDWCTISSDLELSEAIAHCSTVPTAPTVSMSITGRPLFRVSVFDANTKPPAAPAPTPVADDTPCHSRPAPSATANDPIATLISSVMSSPAARPIIAEVLGQSGGELGGVDANTLISTATSALGSNDVQSVIRSLLAGQEPDARQVSSVMSEVEKVVNAVVREPPKATQPAPAPAPAEGQLYDDYFNDLDFDNEEPPVPLPSDTKPVAVPTPSSPVPSPVPSPSPSPVPSPVPSPATTASQIHTPWSKPSPAPVTVPSPDRVVVSPPASPTPPVAVTPVPTGTGTGSPKTPMFLARFVRDVTMHDNSTVHVGQRFSKTWCYRNDGDEPWPTGTTLTWVGGERMAVNISTPVESCPPHATTEFTAELQAPTIPGRYVTYFVLQTPDGVRFGQRMWVDVLVVPDGGSNGGSTPVLPEVTPPSQPSPVRPPSTPDVNVPAKYEENMALLESMGFTNRALNFAILEHNKNHFQNALTQLCEINK